MYVYILHTQVLCLYHASLVDEITPSAVLDVLHCGGSGLVNETSAMHGTCVKYACTMHGTGTKYTSTITWNMSVSWMDFCMVHACR